MPSTPSNNPTLAYSYSYDRFGNRWNQTVTTGTGRPVSLTFDGNNRINTGGYRYDAVGNLMMDSLNCYTYDAENRLTSVAPQTAGGCGVCGATTMNYLYDPDGRRVARLQNGSIVKQYYYDAAGHMITEADANGATLRAEIYAGSRHLATWTGNATYFNHADWLGTERARSDSSGNRCETITSLPFGDGQSTSGSCTPTPTFFTGKERDSESGLDYFGTRYFGGGNSLGRFMTPDDFFKDSHVDDPQSWNEYAYARNNPLRYVDPNGENATITTNCTTTEDDKTTCQVNISASFAIYAASGSVTQDQLNQAATAMENAIDNAWTGSFTQNGITYNVTTQVSVSVAADKDAAVKTGAQNVIGMINGPPAKNEDADVSHRPLLGGTGGPDTGRMNINDVGGVAAHEFTHLLGVNDKQGPYLSNTNGREWPNPIHATSQDFRWGIKEATTQVSKMKDAGNLPSDYHIQTTVRAPRVWWK